MTQPDLAQLGVYQVFTGGGTGSSFLVSPTLLLTNAHVVAPFRQVAIERRDRQRVLGTVRRVHPLRDLAIVEVAEPLDGDILAVGTDAPVVANQPVRIVGFPRGLPLSITEGVVSNPNQLLDGQAFVQTDAAVNPGNSGGPMLDEDRRIVAVTTCKLNAAENVGFGIPAPDARSFLDGFAAQSAPFGVMCSACDELHEAARRYCAGCGSDLDGLDLRSYFDPPPPHPVTAFVERALAAADVDPVLARHGGGSWSFYRGSAPIFVGNSDANHLCFVAPLVRPGKRQLAELFRYLLADTHEPLAFDLADNVIRLSLTLHVSDVFAPDDGGELPALIAQFVEAADRLDNELATRFGCEPAPTTQLAVFRQQHQP